jgi:hypothetical protein
MGVASIVTRPPMHDAWGTVRSTRDVAAVQKWTSVLWTHQCLSNISSTHYINGYGGGKD